jgi:hypothetical protein
MRFPFTIAALVLSLCAQVSAKAAFAHFMVSPKYRFAPQ